MTAHTYLEDHSFLNTDGYDVVTLSDAHYAAKLAELAGLEYALYGSGQVTSGSPESNAQLRIAEIKKYLKLK